MIESVPNLSVHFGIFHFDYILHFTTLRSIFITWRLKLVVDCVCCLINFSCNRDWTFTCNKKQVWRRNFYWVLRSNRWSHPARVVEVFDNHLLLARICAKITILIVFNFIHRFLLYYKGSFVIYWLISKRNHTLQRFDG